MLLLRILALLTVAATASGVLRHYFAQNPKRSDVTDNLHGGFEAGIVGTEQLPIAIFDGIYHADGKVISGRMRWLPWLKRFMDDFLFQPRFMDTNRLAIDRVISDMKKVQFKYSQTNNNSKTKDRVDFLLYHFSARFIETFMKFEMDINSQSVPGNTEGTTINLDIMTQMYHFAYCEAMAHLNHTEKDLFNRCPNPCKAGRLLSTTNKCPPGRDCNPCLSVTENLEDHICVQKSRLWRRDFTCNCQKGYTWDNNTLTCRQDKDYLQILRLRSELSFSIDSLNIFMDSQLPKMFGLYETPQGLKRIDLNVEDIFHPFGHESFSTLQVARRMQTNWVPQGTVLTDPKPFISVDFENTVLVERMLVNVDFGDCRTSLLPTGYLLTERVNLASSGTFQTIFHECLASSDCQHLVIACVDSANNDTCYKISSSKPIMSSIGYPLSKYNVFSDRKRCYNYRDSILYTCSSFFKTCTNHPPRLLVSTRPGSDIVGNLMDQQWQPLTVVDRCLNESTMKAIKWLSASLHQITSYGDYRKCIDECQKRCARVIFFSAEICYCSSEFTMRASLRDSTRPCGMTCSHRYNLHCGGRKFFQPYLLQPLASQNCETQRQLIHTCVELVPVIFTVNNIFETVYGIWKTRIYRRNDDSLNMYTHGFLPGLIRIPMKSSWTPNDCRQLCLLSCMRVFALSSTDCYCANSTEMLTGSKVRETNDCTSPRVGMIGQNSLSVGTIKEAVAMYDMGELTFENCAIEVLEPGIPIPDFVSTSAELGPVGLQNVTWIQHLGCFLASYADLTSKYQRMLFSHNTSIEDSDQVCLSHCSKRCMPFAYNTYPYCFCLPDSPHRLQMLEAGLVTNDLCHPMLSNRWTEQYPKTHTSVGYRNKFTSNAFELITLSYGFGSLYLYIARNSGHTAFKYYRGCHSFVGRDIPYGTAIRLYYINAIPSYYNVSPITPEGCSDHCYTRLRCQFKIDCDFHILICSFPDCTAAQGFCICVPQGWESSFKRVDEFHCPSNHMRITDAPPMGGQYIHATYIRGGTVMKTPVTFKCALSNESAPGIVTAYPKTDANCFSDITPKEKFPIDNPSECIRECRLRRKTFFSIFVKSLSLIRGITQCACFTEAEVTAFPAANSQLCEATRMQCNPRDLDKNCGLYPYVYIHKIHVSFKAESMECKPLKMLQPGFYNISFMYTCPLSMESARSISIRPAIFQTETPSLNPMIGLLGLTKIDIHRGEIQIPVLTYEANPSVKHLLRGLLQDQSQSNFTLAMDSQVRARYAYWDTWMRTVFQRTFNVSVNRCKLPTTRAVIISSFEEEVRCKCREDYGGKYCDVPLQGCDYLSGSATQSLRLGKAACNVQKNQKSGNICYNSVDRTNWTSAGIMPKRSYTCRCGSESQRDESLPFDNCLLSASVCRHQYCGEGVCTGTADGGWRCLCRDGRTVEKDGTCSQRDPIYLFTSWSDWTACHPDCGPTRSRNRTRQCLLATLQDCQRATPDNEILRTRTCRPRSCRRHISQQALDAYEELTGETLDLGSGSLALICLAVAASCGSGLFLVIVMVLSPGMYRSLLEESLWFMLVTRNRLARIVNLPLLLVSMFRRRRRLRRAQAAQAAQAAQDSAAAADSGDAAEAAESAGSTGGGGGGGGGGFEEEEKNSYTAAADSAGKAKAE